MRKFIFAAALVFAPISQAAALLRLPALISDHMVLQAGVPIKIWGWAGPAKSVSVTLGSATATATADANGRFSAVLAAMPAGGPFELSVVSDSSLLVHDVLIGEVWLGSGQSNMEFTLSHTLDSKKTVPAAGDDKLRLFQLERKASDKLEEDCKGAWKLSSPESAADFSAVAWHFGKNIRGALKTPVGMIASSWGGTPAEAWTPKTALMANLTLAAQAKIMESDQTQMTTWAHGLDFAIEVKDIRVLDSKGKALESLPKFSAKNWTHTEKTGSKTELSAKDQSAIFKGTVEGGSWASVSIVPGGSGTSINLSGAETIEFKVRGNGKAIVLLHQPIQTDWDDFGSEAFEFGKDWKTISVPVKSLKQGGWGKASTLNTGSIEAISFSIRIPFWPDIPEMAYNGMISPLLPYAIKGVLWYQGESNGGRGNQYKALLSTMIQSWRAAWGIGDFPFLIVQLPDFADSDWKDLRQAQLDTAKAVPNCGLISTLGLGEAHNIHPRNKTDVGRRLADLALAQVYGKKMKGKGALVYNQKVLSH